MSSCRALIVYDFAFVLIAPPATPEADLRRWFDSVDTDRSGQLSTEELQRALVNGIFISVRNQTSALSISTNPNMHIHLYLLCC
jgi:hypothetical protein